MPGIVPAAMGRAPPTCWDLIRTAAAGSRPAQQVFVERYHDCVRAYLRHRWAGTPLCDTTDDAVQEVFLQCLREQGALAAARPDLGNGFRAYLYGITRNVARSFERRSRRMPDPVTGADPHDAPSTEPSVSRVFDRSYALTVLRHAAELMSVRASARSEAHRRRVDLLHLRFDQGRPIREIASDWQVDAKWLHHQLEQAAKEFLVALQKTIGLPPHAPRDRVRQECQELLALLQS